MEEAAASPVTTGRHQAAKQTLWLAATLVYAVILWFWGSGRADLVGSMESRRAVGAAGMLRDGDFLVPRIGEQVYLAKPALFYWAVSAISGFAPDGVTPATLRGTSALFALLTVIALYVSVVGILGRKASLLACLVCVTTPMVFEQAIFGDVNTLLSLGVSVAILSAFRVMESGRPAWMHGILCGVGLAAGVMAKGPIVLMFFVPTILAYSGMLISDRLTADWRKVSVFLGAASLAVWGAAAVSCLSKYGALGYMVPAGMLLFFGLRKRGRIGRGATWLIAALVAAALILPWPVMLAVRITPEALLEVLKQEMWDARITEVIGVNREPVWFYLYALTGAALPYTLIAPVAFLGCCSRRNNSVSRLLLLAKCWLVSSVVVFSFSTPARETRYLLPVFPALAILAGSVLNEMDGNGPGPRARRYLSGVGNGVLLLVCVTPAILPVVWITQGLQWGPMAWAMTAFTAAGAVIGIWMRFAKHARLAWMPALMVSLIGVKILVQFGRAEEKSRADSFRAQAAGLLAAVPAGETLYLTGPMSAAAIYYLRPVPLMPEFAPPNQALSEASALFVAVEIPTNAAAPPIPQGFVPTDIASIAYRERQVKILRLDRAPDRKPETRTTNLPPFPATDYTAPP
jgi:4-amino-4-deoxy-L-arabinose transferase-like glycosyltransferase